MILKPRSIIINIYLSSCSWLQPCLQRHVGLNPTTLGLQDISIGLDSNSVLAVLLVLGKGLVAVEVLVDDSRHAC
jgi:hypothetical protein